MCDAAVKETQMDKYWPTLTVFICFAIEQEFVVVVLQEASSSLFSLHIHESGKTLLVVSSRGS